MFKKTLLVLLTLIAISLSFFPHLALAQDKPPAWVTPSYQDFLNKVNNAPENEIFGERYTMAQVYWIFNSLLHLLSGEAGDCLLKEASPEVIKTCIQNLTNASSNTSPDLAKSRPANLGTVMSIGAIADMMLKVQPASGIDYIAGKLERFDLMPAAHAQGYGFRALQPSQKLWAMTRNATYALFTLAILVVAFMIMFRVKISPQAVISVQSALPKIVISLILVTFSYAIAGLLIDLMYVMQGVVAVIAAQSGIVKSDINPIQMLYNLQASTGGIMAFGLATIIQGLSAGGIAGAVMGPGIPAAVADFIIGILLLIVFVIAAIRLLFSLIKSYVTVLLLVIGAPFMLLWAAISPSGSVTGWIRQILAHLTVFPLTGILIFMAHVLYWTSANYSNGTVGLGAAGCNGGNVGLPSAFNPYYVCGISSQGSVALPSFSMDVSIVGFLAGLVLMISIPSFSGALKNMILNARADYGSDLVGAQRFVTGTGKNVGTAGLQYYSSVFGNNFNPQEATGSQLRINAVLNALKNMKIIR